MSTLKSQNLLKHPQTHSPSFSPLPGPGYPISGKEIEACGSGSPQFFPVICAWPAGLLWFPAPSAVSPGSAVLNPNLHGTFSWPTARVLSPLSFLQCLYCILPHCQERALHRFYILLSSFLSCMAKGAPKLHSSAPSQKPRVFPNLKTMSHPTWLGCLNLHAGWNLPLHPHSDSSHNQLHLPALTYFSSFFGLP